MSVARQGRYYVLVGIFLWLLDWGVTVGLSHGGLAIEPANVLGRICGALLGFWLNGRFTFSGDEHQMGRKQFARFLLMWVVTTAISTLSMGAIDDWFGLQWAWIAKPAVEVALGGAGFLLSRYWIYRH